MECGLLRIDGGFGFVEDAEELRDDFLAAPVKIGEILQPLEIRDNHAAGIAKNVGDNLDVAAGLDDFVGGVGGGAIGSFGEDATFELGCVLIGDDPLEGGRDENGARELEQLFVGNRFASIEVAEGFLVLSLDSAVESLVFHGKC